MLDISTSDREVALEFLNCARKDLNVAIYCEQKKIYSLSAYHLQQSIEKLAKMLHSLMGVKLSDLRSASHDVYKLVKIRPLNRNILYSDIKRETHYTINPISSELLSNLKNTVDLGTIYDCSTALVDAALKIIHLPRLDNDLDRKRHTNCEFVKKVSEGHLMHMVWGLYGTAISDFYRECGVDGDDSMALRERIEEDEEFGKVVGHTYLGAAMAVIIGLHYILSPSENFTRYPDKEKELWPVKYDTLEIISESNLKLFSGDVTFAMATIELLMKSIRPDL